MVGDARDDDDAPVDTGAVARAWRSGCVVQTVSGRYVDLIEPQPETIRINDIAYALSRQARFNGHTKGKNILTVAQHSVAVMLRVPTMLGPVARMTALLHDAHEAYIGDIVTPVARILGADAIDALKRRVQSAIHRALDVPEPSAELQHLVATCDRDQLLAERDQYLPGRTRSTARVTWPMREAEHRFLHAFETLAGEVS